MTLGTLLVLIGLVCAVLELIPVVVVRRFSLLALAVVLIAIGVLLGVDPLLEISTR